MPYLGEEPGSKAGARPAGLHRRGLRINMDSLLAALASCLLGISVLFSKAGMSGIHPYLVNAITNTVVFVLFLAASVVTGTIGQLKQIDSWGLMVLSGAALAGSWLFYYLGLKDGPVGAVMALQNVSIILPWCWVLCCWGRASLY